MLTLAETQFLFRNGLVCGSTVDLRSLIVGGLDPEKRFAIHRRHYETSLVTALLDKFPATAWLVGTRFLAEAAKQFVHQYPPHAPCIAEYGEEFPRFLTACPGAARVPYLDEFAELEWQVGHVAIATQGVALGLQEFSAISSEELADTVVALQPGVRYLGAVWPVDELMKLYLSENAPQSFPLNSAAVWLQVRGARGEFHIDRLDAAQFIFRKSISEGLSIGDAAERAFDAESVFDAGQALLALITEGLVIEITSDI